MLLQTALVKLLLKILVLLTSFQISNGIHNSYLQYVTISTQKLDIRTKVLYSRHCDNFLFGVTTTASEELVICSSIVVVATCVQLVAGRIALAFILVSLFLDNQTKFYNCNIKNILYHFCF